MKKCTICGHGNEAYAIACMRCGEATWAASDKSEAPTVRMPSARPPPPAEEQETAFDPDETRPDEAPRADRPHAHRRAKRQPS